MAAMGGIGIRWVYCLLLWSAAVVPGGCSGPSADAGGFDNPNPSAKMYAIMEAGRQRDVEAIPDLIEQLNSDDPAVRMLAIHALDRITGKRLGYNAYDPPNERQESIERWIAAYDAGRLTAAEPPPDSTD